MTPEEVILEMNWTFDSDPGRFKLWEQLIKPAMIRYASLNRQGWTEGFNWKEEYDQAVNEIGQLQEQLKEAESEIRSLQSELNSR